MHWVEALTIFNLPEVARLLARFATSPGAELWLFGGLILPSIYLHMRVSQMGFDLGSLQIDQNISDQGVWVDFYGGSALRIRSTSSQKFKAAMARLVSEHRLQLDTSNPAHVRFFQELEAEALATEVLMDWRGIDWTDSVTGQRTENVPYTPALGKEALMSMDKFKAFVTENAGKESLFKASMIAETTGN